MRAFLEALRDLDGPLPLLFGFCALALLGQVAALLVPTAPLLGNCVGFTGVALCLLGAARSLQLLWRHLRAKWRARRYEHWRDYEDDHPPFGG